MVSSDASTLAPPRAFLRWAGGKIWLVRRIASLFGDIEFNRYHEPFLGGGSFFFAVANGREAYLSDKSDALIEVYRTLRENHLRVIEFMRTLENTKEQYYTIRTKEFDCPFQRAGQFIYLNQTSFNGIYRVNLRGIYNVPYGNREKIFLDESVLKSAAIALEKTNLSAGDFENNLENIGEGDLVFIDPPYTVSHNQNGFIKYNKSLFSIEDQARLSIYISEVKRKKASYILTNAAHDKIREIFEMGDTCVEVRRASLVGGKKAERGQVSEYIFTNLKVRST